MFSPVWKPESSVRTDKELALQYGFAQLLGRMVEQQPLWQPKSPSSVKKVNKRLDNDMRMRNACGYNKANEHQILATDNLQLHAKETHDTASYQSVKKPQHHTWPTPDAAAWTDIETVACRVMITLKWVLAQLKHDHEPKIRQDELWIIPGIRQEMLILLHPLLAGHVLDDQLD